MTTTFILLFKGALGTGGGFGALLFFIVAFVIIYWLEKGKAPGCLGILLLPLMPVIGLVSLFGELDKKGFEKEMNASGTQFDGPPSLLLKVLVVLSLIAVWVLVIGLMANYDVSHWWVGLWVIMMPLASINLYMLWLNVFFAHLGRLRDRTAMVVCIIAIVLIVVFWIVAIPAYSHYTSDEYLSLYWRRKYGLD